LAGEYAKGLKILDWQMSLSDITINASPSRSPPDISLACDILRPEFAARPQLNSKLNSFHNVPSSFLRAFQSYAFEIENQHFWSQKSLQCSTLWLEDVNYFDRIEVGQLKNRDWFVFDR
jgi:hypothetical protein